MRHARPWAVLALVVLVATPGAATRPTAPDAAPLAALAAVAAVEPLLRALEGASAPDAILLAARAHGLDVSPRPAPLLPLSTGVARLAARDGVELPDGALDGVPIRLVEPVARIVSATVRAQELREEAFARLSLDEQAFLRDHAVDALEGELAPSDAERYAELASRIRYEPLVEAAWLLAEAGTTAMPELATPLSAGVGGPCVDHVENATARSVLTIREGPACVWRHATAVGIALAGHHEFRHNAGGAECGTRSGSTTFALCVAVHVDASTTAAYNAVPTATGARFAGDVALNSTQTAQGAALLGVGVLVHGNGAATFCAAADRLLAQGAAALGVGVLTDLGAPATFRAGSDVCDVRPPALPVPGRPRHLTVAQGGAVLGGVGVMLASGTMEADATTDEAPLRTRSGLTVFSASATTVAQGAAAGTEWLHVAGAVRSNASAAYNATQQGAAGDALGLPQEVYNIIQRETGEQPRDTLNVTVREGRYDPGVRPGAALGVLVMRVGGGHLVASSTSPLSSRTYAQGAGVAGSAILVVPGSANELEATSRVEVDSFRRYDSSCRGGGLCDQVLRHEPVGAGGTPFRALTIAQGAGEGGIGLALAGGGHVARAEVDVRVNTSIERLGGDGVGFPGHFHAVSVTPPGDAVVHAQGYGNVGKGILIGGALDDAYEVGTSNDARVEATAWNGSSNNATAIAATGRSVALAQGYALLGTGVLYDPGGDDAYRASQSAATASVSVKAPGGALNSTYAPPATRDATVWRGRGAAPHEGVAALLEPSGRNSYSATPSGASGRSGSCWTNSANSADASVGVGADLGPTAQRALPPTDPSHLARWSAGLRQPTALLAEGCPPPVACGDLRIYSDHFSEEWAPGVFADPSCALAVGDRFMIVLERDLGGRPHVDATIAFPRADAQPQFNVYHGPDNGDRAGDPADCRELYSPNDPDGYANESRVLCVAHPTGGDLGGKFPVALKLRTYGVYDPVLRTTVWRQGYVSDTVLLVASIPVSAVRASLVDDLGRATESVTYQCICS